MDLGPKAVAAVGSSRTRGHHRHTARQAGRLPGDGRGPKCRRARLPIQLHNRNAALDASRVRGCPCLKNECRGCRCHAAFHCPSPSQLRRRACLVHSNQNECWSLPGALESERGVRLGSRAIAGGFARGDCARCDSSGAGVRGGVSRHGRHGVASE